MAHFDLFRLDAGQSMARVPARPSADGPTVRALFEKHLDALLGVRVLATEHSTGKLHGGCIDLLGLDEDDRPVIVQHKRHAGENILSQGLYHLDWLLDHRADFAALVARRIGPEVVDAIDWSAPRILCLATQHDRYDRHAVRHLRANVELLRYRHFAPDLLLLERLLDPVGAPPRAAVARHDDALAADTLASELVAAIEAFLFTLGDEVLKTPLRYHVAFKRLRNFVCLVPQARHVLAYLRLDPAVVALEEGFSRDVTRLGHLGTGDVELVIDSFVALERAKPLFRLAYEA